MKDMLTPENVTDGKIHLPDQEVYFLQLQLLYECNDRHRRATSGMPQELNGNDMEYQP